VTLISDSNTITTTTRQFNLHIVMLFLLLSLVLFIYTYGVGFGERNLLIEEVGHRLMVEKIDFDWVVEVDERFDEYPFLSTATSAVHSSPTLSRFSVSTHSTETTHSLRYRKLRRPF